MSFTYVFSQSSNLSSCSSFSFSSRSEKRFRNSPLFFSPSFASPSFSRFPSYFWRSGDGFCFLGQSKGRHFFQRPPGLRLKLVKGRGRFSFAPPPPDRLELTHAPSCRTISLFPPMESPVLSTPELTFPVATSVGSSNSRPLVL